MNRRAERIPQQHTKPVGICTAPVPSRARTASQAVFVVLAMYFLRFFLRRGLSGAVGNPRIVSSVSPSSSRMRLLSRTYAVVSMQNLQSVAMRRNRAALGEGGLHVRRV